MGHTVSLDPLDLLEMPDYLDWLVRKVPLDHPDLPALQELQALRGKVDLKALREWRETQGR